ncbi:MAG: hypothetical protein NZ555_07620 [Geminicoccaceae bacterium]|nr:hypothetical protein [Geminicoccaceae bacterium]MDW8369242.1 hypothetical protein [Geminicoccaceae bacterium]
MRATARASLAAAALFLLAGCGAVSDEGAIDFRFARREPVGPAWVKLQPDDPGELPIGQGEIVQIVLETAFVADFWAVFGHPAVSGGRPNGEIAIVVSAFEDDGRTPDRFGADALANARVVYFSDDVVEGQFLNVGPGLPIWGPAEYRGFPLRIDLWIVELDQPGDQARRLLSVLAALGGTAWPAAAPLAAPLARLAGTLVTDRQDDPAFHYTLTLGTTGSDGLAGVPLVPADIVLVRQKQRDRDTDWNALRFHPQSGRLAYNRPDCEKAELPPDCTWREQTYLVLRVARAARPLEGPRVPLALDELRRRFAAESPPILTEAGLAEAEAAFAELGAALAARDRADALRAPLAELAGRAGCAADGTPMAPRRRAAEQFVAGWFAPTTGPAAAPALSSEDRANLLARAGDRIARTVTDLGDFGELMAALRAGSADAATRSQLTAALAACPPPSPTRPAGGA